MGRHRQFARVVLGCLAISVAAACGRSKRSLEPPNEHGNIGGEAGAGSGTGAQGHGGTPDGAGGPSGGAGEGGAAGQGGGAGEDAGSGGAGGADLGEQDCSLLPVGRDEYFSFEVEVASLTVEVTVNGEPLPDLGEGRSRAVVRARDRTTGGITTFDLGSSGPARATGPIFEGTYDLSFHVMDAGAIEGIEPPASTVLAADIAIAEDEALSFEVATVRLAGAVTLNGEQLPDGEASRGTLDFRDRVSMANYYVELSSTGHAAYDAVLFAGRYDVFFQSSDALAGELPYAARVRVARDVELTDDQKPSFDLRPVEVSVTLTGNGESLPPSPDAFRGRVSFSDRASGTVYQFDAGAEGPTSFTARVFPSEYDVTFTTGAQIPGPFPASGATRLARGLVIAGGEALGYDVKPVAVSGALRVNGEAPGDHPQGYARGSVSFRDTSTGKVYDFEVGAAGDALYSGYVFAGTYDVSFESSVVPLPGLPRSGVVRLEDDIAIGDARARDYDVSVVNVGGTVTNLGQALPGAADAAQRGKLSFRDSRSGNVQELALGTGGAATYAGPLFAGHYDVAFHTGDDAVTGLPRSASTPLARRLEIASARTHDFDLRPRTISGVISVNGGVMPDSPGVTTRGALVLREKFTNVSRTFDLGDSGPGDFEALVFEGSYDASLQTSDAKLFGLPWSTTTLLERGCIVLPSCSGSRDDLAGHWTFVFDLAGWGPLAVELTDEGGALAGPFSTPTDTGDFTGSRAGDAFTLSAELGTAGCSPLTLHATLFDECGVSGYATCGGFSSYNPRFTGFR